MNLLLKKSVVCYWYAMLSSLIKTKEKFEKNTDVTYSLLSDQRFFACEKTSLKLVSKQEVKDSAKMGFDKILGRPKVWPKTNVITNLTNFKDLFFFLMLNNFRKQIFIRKKVLKLIIAKFRIFCCHFFALV